MAKIDRGTFSRMKFEVLKLADLGGAEATALMLSRTEHFNMDDRQKLALIFEETGEKALVLNVTSIDRMIEAYGDDDDNWIGKPVVIMRQQGKDTNNKPFDNLWVAPMSEWSDVLKELDIDDARPNAPKGVKSAKSVKRSTRR